jgi:selenocysteine-specific elongation factor
MTGTVLGGQVKAGDNIELPNLGVEKKVKSMQMFRKPVQAAHQGDRLGICVAQLDAGAIERGLACTPGTMKSCDTVLAAVEKIKFFTDPVVTKTKFHITIGHQTAIGLVHFFSGSKTEGTSKLTFNKGSLKSQHSDF